MSVLQLPPCPASLKPIQHYLKTAAEHEIRDPVITYWCRVYAVQSALKIDKKSDEAKLLLIELMDWLEKQKKLLSENEAITNEIAAQAHVENHALKLFTWADGQDRAGVFNKNVVKAFYTAGMLMDVLSTFGETGEEILSNCKYAKWKAAYIHNCLRNGETPVPGPVGWDKEQEENNEYNSNENSDGISHPSNIGFNIPASTSGQQSNYISPNEQNEDSSGLPVAGRPQDFYSSQPQSSNIPSPERIPQYPSSGPHDTDTTLGSGSSIKLEPSQISKAQKYCKFASSALNYDDISEAINNLQKALKLLQTGQDN